MCDSESQIGQASEPTPIAIVQMPEAPASPTEKWIAATTGIAAFLFLLDAVKEPNLKLVDPMPLLLCVWCFGVAIQGFYWWATSTENRLIVFIASLSALIFGMMVGYHMVGAAAQLQNAENRRCAILQRAMLHPSSRTRKDLPAVFTALKCEPQR